MLSCFIYISMSRSLAVLCHVKRIHFIDSGDVHLNWCLSDAHATKIGTCFRHSSFLSVRKHLSLSLFVCLHFWGCTCSRACYLVFTRMSGESYRTHFRSLLLCPLSFVWRQSNAVTSLCLSLIVVKDFDHTTEIFNHVVCLGSLWYTERSPSTWQRGSRLSIDLHSLCWQVS